MRTSTIESRVYPRPVGALISKPHRLLILDTDGKPMGVIVSFGRWQIAVGGRKG